MSNIQGIKFVLQCKDGRFLKECGIWKYVKVNELVEATEFKMHKDALFIANCQTSVLGDLISVKPIKIELI